MAAVAVANPLVVPNVSGDHDDKEMLCELCGGSEIFTSAQTSASPSSARRAHRPDDADQEMCERGVGDSGGDEEVKAHFGPLKDVLLV